MTPTIVRDLLEAAADALDRPADFDVLDLAADLESLAAEFPGHAHEARRFAARLRSLIA